MSTRHRMFAVTIASLLFGSIGLAAALGVGTPAEVGRAVPAEDLNEIRWNEAIDSFFGNPFNWELEAVPDADDWVVFEADVIRHTIYFDVSPTNRSASIRDETYTFRGLADPGSYTLTEKLSVSNGGLYIRGLTVTSPSLLIDGGYLDLNFGDIGSSFVTVDSFSIGERDNPTVNEVIVAGQSELNANAESWIGDAPNATVNVTIQHMGSLNVADWLNIGSNSGTTVSVQAAGMLTCVGASVNGLTGNALVTVDGTDSIWAN